MRIKYAIASLAVGGSLAASALAGAEPASADPTPQMSFNLQYLQLQSQMEHENRSYAAVSNIMRTKHVTVTNLIGNIR